jgi:hypothetical protein
MSGGPTIAGNAHEACGGFAPVKHGVINFNP